MKLHTYRHVWVGMLLCLVDLKCEDEQAAVFLDTKSLKLISQFMFMGTDWNGHLDMNDFMTVDRCSSGRSGWAWCEMFASPIAAAWHV